jgi:hypothetical protein
LHQPGNDVLAIVAAQLNKRQGILADPAFSKGFWRRNVHFAILGQVLGQSTAGMGRAARLELQIWRHASEATPLHA